jgi:hypothetical protein
MVYIAQGHTALTIATTLCSTLVATSPHRWSRSPQTPKRLATHAPLLMSWWACKGTRMPPDPTRPDTGAGIPFHSGITITHPVNLVQCAVNAPEEPLDRPVARGDKGVEDQPALRNDVGDDVIRLDTRVRHDEVECERRAGVQQQ